MTQNTMNLETALQFATETLNGMPLWAMIALPFAVLNYDGILRKDRSTTVGIGKSVLMVIAAFAGAAYLGTAGSMEWAGALMGLIGFNTWRHAKKYTKKVEKYTYDYCARRSSYMGTDSRLPLSIVAGVLACAFTFVGGKVGAYVEKAEAVHASFASQLADPVLNEDNSRTRQVLVYSAGESTRSGTFYYFDYINSDGSTDTFYVHMSNHAMVEAFRPVKAAVDAVENGESGPVIVNLRENLVLTKLDSRVYSPASFEFVAPEAPNVEDATK